MGREEVIIKELKETETSCEGVKNEVLNRWGKRMSLCSHFDLRRLGALTNC